MGYVSFNDVIELNGILKEKGLNFKIHLRDTCGCLLYTSPSPRD